MGDDVKRPDKPGRPPRSWITQTKNHSTLRHQLNIKVSQEVNDLLRDGARRENLHIYEFIEKAVIFYARHPDNLATE